MICDELVKESMASMRDQAHTVWREIAEQSYHFARHEKVSDFFKLVPVALYMGPFIYYVITFLGFLGPPPPYISMFLVLRICKN